MDFLYEDEIICEEVIVLDDDGDGGVIPSSVNRDWCFQALNFIYIYMDT